MRICCIYDPTLVEIHQSMWKVEPNVNLFSQQQQTTADKVIPIICVFPAKARKTTKHDCYLYIYSTSLNIHRVARSRYPETIFSTKMTSLGSLLPWINLQAHLDSCPWSWHSAPDPAAPAWQMLGRHGNYFLPCQPVWRKISYGIHGFCKMGNKGNVTGQSAYFS